jgi:hypothetical protein
MSGRGCPRSLNGTTCGPNNGSRIKQLFLPYLGTYLGTFGAILSICFKEEKICRKDDANSYFFQFLIGHPAKKNPGRAGKIHNGEAPHEEIK